MSKSSKLSSTFKSRRFTDIPIAASNKHTLSAILNKAHNNEEEVEKSLDELRCFILEKSLINLTENYRQTVWKLFLEVHYVSATCYIDLLQNGLSAYHSNIENDTTLVYLDESADSDPSVLQKIQRLLNAFVWLHTDSSRLTSTETVFVSKLLLRHQPAHWKFAYVNTMSHLTMPFIKVMPELDAFFAFTTFIRHACPLYVQSNFIGAHCGVKLLDTCLKMVDPELFGYLRGKGLSADMYAFAEISTFSASTPPLAEVLHLWDVMFAFGFHLNILFVLAQLVRRRTKILSSTSPIHLIRSPPPLNVQSTIGTAFRLLDMLPDNLYLHLVRHPYDETIAHELGVDVSEGEHQYFEDEESVSES